MSICFGTISRCRLTAGLAILAVLSGETLVVGEPQRVVLDASDARFYVQAFNESDEEDVVNLVPNSQALEWIGATAPLFDCPSTRFEETYYFRWWTYRKHICQTPHGRVLTEFITPVSHAGPYNTISCAYGHHLSEGRWLWDRDLLDEYTHFWYRSGEGETPADHFHKFSSWAAAALYERYLATGDADFLIDLLDDLVADFRTWESERMQNDGLFWQYDVRDGMEESISGGRRVKNVRPTINSYMVGNAKAIASIALLAQREDLAREFSRKAMELNEAMLAALWDSEAGFFKVRLETGELSDAREAIGYIPWLYGVPKPEHAVAWRQIKDRQGFWAPRGLATAERRHPGFRSHGVGTCEWDGAVWPFATSQTLGALAKVLRETDQPTVTRRDFFEQLLRYAEAHQQHGRAYIGEYHDEVSGEWLITGPKAKRSRFYNHSTFNDLVIGGLVGIVPHADGKITIDPLLPPDTWDWFCLDGVAYHGQSITVVWDRNGTQYNRAVGLSLWINGELAASSPTLSRLEADLP